MKFKSITMVKEIFDWISLNKNWIFEGVGVAFLTAIAVFLYNKWKKEKKDDSVSIKIKGNKNYQAGRDINIINPTEKKTKLRPIIEIEIKVVSKGQINKGYSPRNPEVIMVTQGIIYFELTWEYEISICNNSNVTAYNIHIDFEGNSFSYLEKLDKLNNIPANSYKKLKANYRKMAECKGSEAQQILKSKFPTELENTVMRISYLDEERENFVTISKIQDDNVINEI